MHGPSCVLQHVVNAARECVTELEAGWQRLDSSRLAGSNSDNPEELQRITVHPSCELDQVYPVEFVPEPSTTICVT